MVGYRDEKETFLVDFEQKRWQHDAEQGEEQGAPAAGSTAAQDCPEDVVRRHLGLAGPAHACRIVMGTVTVDASCAQVMDAVLGLFYSSLETRFTFLFLPTACHRASRIGLTPFACGATHLDRCAQRPTERNN